MMCRSISGKSILVSMQFFPNYLITMTANIAQEDLGITWKITAQDRKRGFGDMVFGVVDVSFVMDPITSRSHVVFVTFNNHELASWRSKLQFIVTLSSAEYVTLVDMSM